MKKYSSISMLFLALPVLAIVLTSFKSNKGGDLFEIYLNGKQVHKQFVHIDQSVKTLQLNAFSDADEIEVFYSHCGYAGKNRVLTLRNEQNAVVKELRFPDVTGTASRMRFKRETLGKSVDKSLKLYYTSTELPDGKLLSIIQWREQKSFAKR